VFAFREHSGEHLSCTAQRFMNFVPHWSHAMTRILFWLLVRPLYLPRLGFSGGLLMRPVLTILLTMERISSALKPCIALFIGTPSFGQFPSAL